MMRLWRLLAIAVALNVTAGAAIAAAQTVMLRNAPPGANVEVLLNDAVVGTGTTSPAGEASIDFKLPEPGELDANVYVDACEKTRRVLVVDRNRRPPPPPPGCERREVSGVFAVRRIHTLVVDVGGLQPSMLLVKGKYTPPKSATAEGDGAESTPMRPAPTGLTLFGGGGFGKFRDAFGVACGNVVCTGHDGGLGYTFGGTFWFTRWLGAEGGYLKPRKVTAKGGDTFKFNTAFDVDVFTVAAKIGIPAGPARIYGLAGGNYHQSTLGSTETIDLATQTFAQKTHGFGWLLGGGTEVWITPKVALYGELSLAQIKGKAEDKGEGRVDDRLRFLAIGARIRLSR
jgi:outer membrane protein with beta-barrel domain